MMGAMTDVPRAKMPDASTTLAPLGQDVHVDRDTLTERLCRAAVQRHRAVEATFGDDDTHNARMVWYGEITGLRIALCLVRDWDPEVDADKEGKADELVMAWWERNEPEYWRPAGPSDI